MKRTTTTYKFLTAKGIMTISVIASVMSFPLVQYIHHLEMERRYALNNNYDGAYGGEILIPLMIIFLGIFLACEADRRRYIKYEKH